ncbi:MAG: hypothetical protein QF619_11230, partial [Candidatus Binatia bacterium]|nr:hypothetical protein [Candidatus Binatia bacterium]
RVIGVRFLPTLFLDLLGLRRMLRHELMHISDMLDEAFLYQDERIGSSPHEEAFIIDRYRVIWDIYIDSRLLRADRETVSGREGRLWEFDRVYRKISSSERSAAFEVLWEMEKMDHPWILRLAKDPTRVQDLAEKGFEEGETKGERKRVLLPGFPCPLCNFPTYVWTEDFGEELCEAVRGDYPKWGLEEGICERCADLYRFRVEFRDQDPGVVNNL